MADLMDVDASPRGTKRTADEAGLPPEAPRRIRARSDWINALDEDVVNKIAAGEIIVAPMNALKEMLENSVDAGSTSIEILVRDGGLKLLQITDNGHGIERDDLPILCQRFTTSKLKTFQDLESIATYGFRGEALASISHIAHLKVTTKTAGSSCAWQAHFQGGKLSPAKPGQSAEPKPTAGRPGTQITVEDLFFNDPRRKRAFRSPSEEYSKILDTVTRYAVHCSHVAFSVKKYGESGTGFSVSAAASRLDRIKQAYGATLAKELMDFETEDARLGFRATGHATNANYQGKKTTILLFINHRLVESNIVKKLIEQTYQIFLPKGGHPFVYLDLEIEPNRVDVNVHPTKREVHFLNEEEIVESVCRCIQQGLAKVDSSRTFTTQTVLPTVISMSPATPKLSGDLDTDRAEPKGSSTKKPNENVLNRTDYKMRKITAMLPPALTRDTSTNDGLPSLPAGIKYTTADRERVQIRLTSIKNLRAEVRDAMHHDLTEKFSTLVFIGVVDANRRLAAIQSGVELYIIDYGMTSNEFFYQVGLTDFGNYGQYKFNPPLPLRELLSIAAALEIGTTPSCAELDQAQVVEKVYTQLMDRKDMMAEYFSLTISNDGMLETIPILLKDYIPSMAKLPTFLLRLGPFVDWTDEQKCFQTFLVEMASFHVPPRLASGIVRESDVADDEEGRKKLREFKDLERVLEHVLFPAFRSRLVATKGMVRGAVEVANLKRLYRVFERC